MNGYVILGIERRDHVYKTVGIELPIELAQERATLLRTTAEAIEGITSAPGSEQYYGERASRLAPFQRRWLEIDQQGRVARREITSIRNGYNIGQILDSQNNPI